MHNAFNGNEMSLAMNQDLYSKYKKYNYTHVIEWMVRLDEDVLTKDFFPTTEDAVEDHLRQINLRTDVYNLRVIAL